MGELSPRGHFGDAFPVRRSAGAPRATTPWRRYLWSEFVPLPELASPALLSTLAARGIGLRAAVYPDDLGKVASVRRAFDRAGVELGLWPLLRDRDGRWGSCDNAEAFSAHALDAARAAGEPAPAMVLDLEPPIGRVRAALRGRLAGPRGSGARWPHGTRELAALAKALRRRAARVGLAAIPAVVADAKTAGWQRALGTPVHFLHSDHVSVMAYSTLLEGYSRGALRRVDAERLLFWLSVSALRRYGARAGVSLGVVGSGALGDEASYRHPSELAEDVAVAQAGGARALGLYGLDGILARPPVEAWLAVFAGSGAACERAPPALTWRARAVAAALTAGSPLLSALFRAATRG